MLSETERCPSHLQEPQSLLGARLHQCDGEADHEGEHRKQMEGYALSWGDEDGVAPVDPLLHFDGGPWHGQTIRGRAITLRPVPDHAGAYWLDTNSGNTPTYFWQPT